MLKLDVEGAEIELVPALVSSNASALVDVLLWECHYVAVSAVRQKCYVLKSRLLAGGVGRIYDEPPGGVREKWRQVLRAPRKPTKAAG